MDWIGIPVAFVAAKWLAALVMLVMVHATRCRRHIPLAAPRFSVLGPMLRVGVPFGVLANRYGRRALVLLGLACLTLASLGFVFAPTYPWLVAARFVQAGDVWLRRSRFIAGSTSVHHKPRSLEGRRSWELRYQ